MKMFRFALVVLLAAAPLARSADAPAVAPPESLILDNVPPIPADLSERAGRYTEFRTATLADWHPTRRECLVLTRFGDTNQVHLVKAPGGARTQLTFFPDRVESAVFEPTAGEFFVFHKGAGGAEFFQNYRYDLATGAVTLLTDGKSRNSPPVFSNDGRRLAFTSTRRNGADTDLYTQDPLDPGSTKLLAEVKGGGWEIQDWSPDNRQILCIEAISINETYLWLFDAQNGQRTELTPRLASGEKIARGKARFVKDGRGIVLTTDNDSEFQRLAYYDFASKQAQYFNLGVRWDVEDFELSHDRDKLACVTNENGSSALMIASGREENEESGGWAKSGFQRVVFTGEVLSALRWQQSGRELGFTLSGATSPADVFSLPQDAPEKPTHAARWTQSETGGLNAEGFAKGRLVTWKSFDDLEISGFLYAPDAAKFPGKRPVIVAIHGGPEAQYRPGYLGRNNFFINELGCAMIFPNVRGSAGYGKTFLALDNGFKREDSYRDIGALFDWIAAQPGLDKDRVLVTGGSYGGHMTLAVAMSYADRIRCALSVVGMSNLRTFLERTESYRRDLRRVEYGDERDPKMREFLDRIAPLNNAAKITKPLFVVQGANDPRVPRNESEQIVATLKKQNTPVSYLVAKDEGHGFAKKRNADFQFYATIEFIRRYLLD